MKAKKFIFRIIGISIVFLLTGGFLNMLLAQEKKQPAQKEAKTVRIKVITKDDNGKIIKIDTIISGGDESATRKLVEQYVNSNRNIQGKEITVKITAGDEGDDEYHLALEDYYEILPDSGVKDQYFHFEIPEEPDFLMPEDQEPLSKMSGCCRIQQDFPFGPGGMTPWGRITKFKIKDKKNGKKIIIETEDTAWPYFNQAYPEPPSPILPPAAKMKKKVTIMKGRDGNEKKVIIRK